MKQTTRSELEWNGGKEITNREKNTVRNNYGDQQLGKIFKSTKRTKKNLSTNTGPEQNPKKTHKGQKIATNTEKKDPPPSKDTQKKFHYQTTNDLQKTRFFLIKVCHSGAQWSERGRKGKKTKKRLQDPPTKEKRIDETKKRKEEETRNS